jgi:hypothetical protein
LRKSLVVVVLVVAAALEGWHCHLELAAATFLT